MHRIALVIFVHKPASACSKTGCSKFAAVCKVSRSGVIPGPTVTVRMREDAPWNLFPILLRERDRGSCAAQNAHVLEYIPLFALRFCYPDPADARSLQIVKRFLHKTPMVKTMGVRVWLFVFYSLKRLLHIYFCRSVSLC